MGVVSTIVGTRLLGDGLVRRVQDSVERDLSTAYLVYNGRLGDIETLVRLVASEPVLSRDILERQHQGLSQLLADRMATWGLDVLAVTDLDGKVVSRGSAATTGDTVRDDPVVARVIDTGSPVSGTVIVPADALAREAPELAERARMELLETPRARPTDRRTLEAGMMLKAAAPIMRGGEMAGVLYGGVLLNRREDIVDRVKRTAYAGETWNNKEIGTVTIFQDDVRIATNVVARDGKRALGTRVSEEVYDRVVGEGSQWVARAFVVDDWYITAYGPILDPDGAVVGIIYVGVLAGKFDAVRSKTVLTFAGVSVAAMVLALVIASILSTGIVRPIRHLVGAARDIAQGHFGTRVDMDPRATGELAELGEAFNFMAQSIAERDAKLQENARKMTESKKLATLGQLAAGIAHEINNPLGGIVMYSHMLLEDLEREENRENVEKIHKQADRCKRIVKGLLDFARQTKPERTESNVNHILSEVIALIDQQAIFRNINITKELNPSIPLLDVDVAQVQEVFMNLILNAAQAMEGKGKLTAKTSLTDDNTSVLIEIADTGPGIPKEDADKIFEPFFTTKEVGRGTGLGLAIAYGIVERHHGSIWVESEVGVGTSFFVRLPLTDSMPEM